MNESGALDTILEGQLMAEPYSDDLQVRAIAIVEGGASRHAVVALFEVSPSSVINWLRRWSDGGCAVSDISACEIDLAA